MPMRCATCPKLCLLASAALLTAMAAQRIAMAVSNDHEQLEQRVTEAIEQVPYRVGAWVGIDTPSPFEASRLLKPQQVLARRYRLRDRADTVDLILQYCRDTRDVNRHYPTLSFPARGWTRVSSTTDLVSVHGEPTPVAVYRFAKVLRERQRELEVVSAVIRGDGRVFAAPDAMRNTWSSPAVRERGMAQVQLIFNHPVTGVQRRETVGRLLEACEPVRASLEMSQAERRH